MLTFDNKKKMYSYCWLYKDRLKTLFLPVVIVLCTETITEQLMLLNVVKLIKIQIVMLYIIFQFFFQSTVL